MKPILFISLLLLFGCQSTRTIPADYEGQRMTFGSGGGFTGAVSTYCLLENGRLYKKEGIPGKNESDFEKIGRLNKSERTSLFSQGAEAIKLFEYDGNPGNMYGFVDCELEAGNGRFSWDMGDPPTGDILYELYLSLMEKVKTE